MPITDLMKELKKYPRTIHLPWSKGKSNDDIGLTDDDLINALHLFNYKYSRITKNKKVKNLKF